MALIDMPLEDLQRYNPPLHEPGDFMDFWRETLEEARLYPINALFERVETGLRLIESYDVTFSGFGGQPIKAWLNLPVQRSHALPCVVQYMGYGCGRGYAQQHLLYAAAGFAQFTVDNRGQSAWIRGDTPDVDLEATHPSQLGFMTRGVLKPHTYFYRRLFTDAVRAIEAARQHPAIDSDHVGIGGGSQGGGIALAVAALDHHIDFALIDVPFLCHYRIAASMVNTMPYHEIAQYCQHNRDHTETVFRTLDYFDGVHFARHASTPALFSVGLMDDICPPRTVFAAYNHYAGEKQIEVYPFNYHEGGGVDQDIKKLAFVHKAWKTS